MAPINTFSSPPARDGSSVISTINGIDLLGKITGDPYFDSTVKFARVDVYYYDSSNRDMKIISHNGPGLSGPASWSPLATDGTWYKTRVRVKDFDGAEVLLDRSSIGTGEDLILT